MSKRPNQKRRPVTRDKSTCTVTVVAGADVPDCVRIKPAAKGLCAVRWEMAAEETDEETIGPFETIHLFLGDGAGGAQWIATRDHNRGEESASGIVYFFSTGRYRYCVLKGKVFKITKPVWETVPTDSPTARQVRAAQRKFAGAWKRAKRVKIIA